MADQKTFKIEDADIIFKNFSGAASQYNALGDRNFSVLLDPDIAVQMLEDGWNVKYLTAREEGDEDRPYIQVSVGYKAKPPHIVMIGNISNTRNILSESMVETLDWADFVTADMIARAYSWEVNGKTGIKAYLQTLYVTIEEDELAIKYAQSDHDSDGAEV